MTDDLAERMRRARIEDLMLMARGRPEDGIAAEAVAAAQAELAQRDITEEDFEEHQAHREALSQADDALPTRRLPAAWWVLFAFIGITIVGTLGIFALFATGRRQMAKDAIVATVLGIAIGWGILISLFVAADLFGS